MLEPALRLGIQRRSCFVQNQNSGIAQQSTGDRNSLPLAPRQTRSPLSHRSLITKRHILNKSVSFCQLRHFYRLFQACRISIISVFVQRNIFQNRSRKQETILRDNTQLNSQRLQRNVPNIVAVNCQPPFFWIIETLQQLYQSALTRTAAADNCHSFSCLHLKAKILQRIAFFILSIAERNIVKLDVSLNARQYQHWFVRAFFRIGREYIIQTLDRNQHFLKLIPKSHHRKHRRNHTPDHHIKSHKLTDRQLVLNHQHSPVPQQSRAAQSINSTPDHLQRIRQLLPAKFSINHAG